MLRRGRHCVRLGISFLLCVAHAGVAQADVNTQVEARVGEAQVTAATAVSEDTAATSGRQGSWVVVPIPVANPTVGNGLQAAVLYLHPKGAGEEASPGTTTGAGAMWTDTRSWLAAAFHDASLSGDRYRVNAAIGLGEFNRRFYGVGAAVLPDGRSVPYELSGSMAQVRLEARLPGTGHWFAGLTYLLMRSRVSFDAPDSPSNLPQTALDSQNAALGPHITYDSRSSNYFPLSGQYFRAGWMNYAPRWGSDRSYDKADVFYNHYLPMAENAVLALRARLQDATQGTPFYDLPTLDMRGFSRDRYRDQDSLSVTAESRYKFDPRWGMAVFVEAGRTAASLSELSEARTIASYGAGIRWQVSQEQDLHLGLDFAISTDDSAVFIQIGERF